MRKLKIEIPKGFEVESFDQESGEIKFRKTPKDVTERIKHPEDAISELGENDIDVIDYRKMLNVGVSDHYLNYAKVVIIIKALNEGWVPDWGDKTQPKYQLYFNMGGSSGSGFSYDDCACWRTASTCGSRLCFREKRLGLYAVKQFPEVFKNFMLIKNQ